MHITYDNKPNNNELSRYLCFKYGVKCVVNDYWIPPERKAELFLLGATFDVIKFKNYFWNVVIYEDYLYLISEVPFSSPLSE